MKFRERKKEDPRISIAPLVDILFLLIIFFTVTTTFATSGGIDVSLPKSSSQAPLEKIDKLFVIINRDGKTFIDGLRLRDDALRARFAEIAAKETESIIVIQADRLAQHGRVVAVMDLASEAGLNRLAIAVEHKTPPTLDREPPEEPAPTDGSTTN